MPLLSIENLSIAFDGQDPVVQGVSFSVAAGETVCVVGESGSGKTVTALSIARLLSSPPVTYPTGKVLLRGEDVLHAPKNKLRDIRGRVVSYIFQEPGASLNPVSRVGNQILEMLKLHRPENATEEEAIRLLAAVGISDPQERIRAYPHQLSGGMQQRVMIAMAIAAHPELLVADEPTTSLDVTIQAQILELLKKLQAEFGMAILFITHNLGIVASIADRVVVMYAGKVVENGPASFVLASPQHAYTKSLLKAVPRLDGANEPLKSAEGDRAGFLNGELIEKTPGYWIRE